MYGAAQQNVQQKKMYGATKENIGAAQQNVQQKKMYGATKKIYGAAQQNVWGNKRKTVHTCWSRKAFTSVCV
jgi:alpha-glucosidase (family GH31 glycosyl hydrolase)